MAYAFKMLSKPSSSQQRSFSPYFALFLCTCFSRFNASRRRRRISQILKITSIWKPFQLTLHLLSNDLSSQRVRSSNTWSAPCFISCSICTFCHAILNCQKEIFTLGAGNNAARAGEAGEEVAANKLTQYELPSHLIWLKCRLADWQTCRQTFGQTDASMKASGTVVDVARSSVTYKKGSRRATLLRRVVGGLASIRKTRKTNAKQSKVK